MRLACTCLGVCHPALSSPLKPERPRGDQSGHLGDPGGRAERAELAQGQAAMPHGVRACPGSMGARLPLGCFQRAPTFALRWHGGWGKGRGGNTRPLDSPASPQASTVPPSPKHPLGDRSYQAVCLSSNLYLYDHYSVNTEVTKFFDVSL